jgi:hypothetical protein
MTVLISMLHPHTRHCPEPPYPSLSKLGHALQVLRRCSISSTLARGIPAATKTAADLKKLSAILLMLGGSII